jgi:hypothetical protein
MTRGRRAMALPIALAALVVLAALAALANAAAVAAVRESAALRDEAQAQATRDALRARVARRLALFSRAALLAQPAMPVGRGDTVLTVLALAWPWHRVLVSAGATPVTAELARARVPDVVWCAGAVSAGAALVPPSVLSAAPAATCPDLLIVATPAEVVAFDSAVVADLVVGRAPEALEIAAGSARTGVWRATGSIVVTPGADIVGLVIAPVVKLAAGVTVRGQVVARDSLIASANSSIVADPQALRNALSEYAALKPLGRRGLLLPP